MNIACIFAGGSGVRMGAGIPKQFLEINGKPIIIHTLQIFQYHDQIDKIYVSVLEDYIPFMKELIEEFHITKVAQIMPGGATAQDSIYNALKIAESENPEDSIVLLSDGVRPFISYETIANNIQSVKEHGNAITCTPCFETILISKTGKTVEEVPYRKHTFSAQAPQSFYLKDIISAHDEIRQSPTGYENMVDACTIIRSLGKTAHMIEGNRGNIKVTTPEDVYMFRALLQYKENEQAFGLGITNRIGGRKRK
ncbi:2-C-methyl-D-erythritol 4-phosphate cytidylyltransferase [Lachnospiraceae bacterium TWA4]|nr:2-C-methyl-D-erythritol 4-phosphate cytidylyltransferase [Lachnospiraceae bacterium TWA4]